MPCQLPTDCLNNVFNYLEERVTLHSCLLVNRLWCETSVRILWRSVWNYETLISCLPKESKEILYKNQIIISNQNLKPLIFNYVRFIKSLSIYNINSIIKNITGNLISIFNLSDASRKGDCNGVSLAGIRYDFQVDP